MERFLYEHRRALLGVVLSLVVAPLLGSVVVGWERALSVLEFLMVVFAALLVLKALSVFVVILLRAML